MGLIVRRRKDQPTALSTIPAPEYKATIARGAALGDRGMWRGSVRRQEPGFGQRKRGGRRGWIVALALMVLVLTGAPVIGAAAQADDVAAIWSDLRVAVLDRLNRAGDEERAGAAYHRLADRLSALGSAARDVDERRRLEEARQRLDAYWLGFQRILELRRQRDRLGDDSLQPIGVDVRLRLQRIMASGKPTEAGVASDLVISMLMVQQYIDRYAARRDPADAGRARQQLEAARRRLDELGRMTLDPPTRASLSEINALLGGYGIAFEQSAAAVADEARLSEEVIDRGGEAMKALLPLPAEATPSADVAPARPPAAPPAPIAIPTPIPAPAPIPAPPPPQGSDHVSAVVVAVALLAPVLGGLAGWLVWFRRRNAALRSSEAAPEPTLDHETAGEPEPEPELDHDLEPGPEPEPGSAVAHATMTDTAVVTGDWLAGMGRMMAALHATGAEVGRLRDRADLTQVDLVEAKALVEAHNRAMAGFLAHLGDQLQGPLAAIVRQGDQLLAALDAHGVNQLTPDVELIQWSGEQLLRMVDSLRAMAEIEAGTVAVAAEDFLIDHLVSDLRERLRSLTSLFGNRLTIQAAQGIGVMHSDYGKVRTALVHLLENACKFTESGDVTLVVMRLEEDGRPVIRFTVTDTGVGIPPEAIDRIFDPFVSFGTARNRGTGLGLTLVHHYAVALDGTVVVDSAPGRGSCFVLTLPADARVQPVAAEPEVARLAAPAEARP